jgi:predicted nucleic acid-binding protein
LLLVDANILMYAGGAEHANKAPSVAFLDRAASGEVDATIDAEVLQEIMHRYRSLGRWQDGQRVFTLARRIFPNVLAVTAEVMDRAKEIADQDAGILTRDAVHAAVVGVYKLEGICSYDVDYDRIAKCKRVVP